MPCKSVPASGSVNASPPRISPVTNFGSQYSRWASVPCFSTIVAIIRWELKMPVSDIHCSEIKETMRA